MSGCIRAASIAFFFACLWTSGLGEPAMAQGTAAATVASAAGPQAELKAHKVVVVRTEAGLGERLQPLQAVQPGHRRVRDGLPEQHGADGARRGVDAARAGRGAGVSARG